MAVLFALGLLCIAAVGPASAQESHEVIIPNFKLTCNSPLEFSGNDDEAACFAQCTTLVCRAVVHMFSGEPGKGTCAVMPGDAVCTPEQANGPFTLKLIVPAAEMFSIHKNHNIGGGMSVHGTLASFHPVPSARTPGADACFAICQFLGCNAIQSDSSHCQLLKLSERPVAMMHAGSPVCHKTTLGFYDNEEIAPAGDCV